MFLRYKETNEVYTIENVYEYSIGGNIYTSLQVYKKSNKEERTYSQIDWEMIKLERNSDLGKYWNQHILDNNEQYELIK